MANGKIRKATSVIVQAGGVLTGSPEKLLKKTRFDGSWEELCASSNLVIDKIDSQYRISTRDSESVPTHQPDLANGSPITFTDAVSAFLLSDQFEDTLPRFSGNYGEHKTVQELLATNICPSIGGLYLPPHTDEPITVVPQEDFSGRGVCFTAESTIFSYFCTTISRS